jgi:hypothetical protein
MGASQVGLGIAGGLITIETGLGPYLGGSLAVMGIDNAAAGCQTAWTGVPRSTLMNQGLQGLGLSETGANISEFALGLSPFAAPKLKQAVMYNREFASFAAQEVRTFLVLKNGNIFRSPIVYNSRSTREVAESVYQKIDTLKFNPNSRFGPAFYTSKEIGTTISELRFHKVNPTHSIQFQLNDKKAIVLDLTQPSIARKWGYVGGDDYTSAKLIAQKAKEIGYNLILYRSERKIGKVNFAIIKDFDKLLTAKKIVQIPQK